MATFEVILRGLETVGMSTTPQHIRQYIVADYYEYENHEAVFYTKIETKFAKVASFPAAAYFGISKVSNTEVEEPGLHESIKNFARAAAERGNPSVLAGTLNWQNDFTGIRARWESNDDFHTALDLAVRIPGKDNFPDTGKHDFIQFGASEQVPPFNVKSVAVLGKVIPITATIVDDEGIPKGYRLAEVVHINGRHANAVTLDEVTPVEYY